MDAARFEGFAILRVVLGVLATVLLLLVIISARPQLILFPKLWG